MVYAIIVLENLRFCPSTRKREDGFFKNLHSGERFWKDAFAVTEFTEYIRETVGQTGNKTKPDTCGQGLSGVVQKYNANSTLLERK